MNCIRVCATLLIICTSARARSGPICNQTHNSEDILEEPKPGSDKYELRPNLFIDKDDLLGKTGHEHKKEFAYGAGPYGCSHWPRLYPKCGGKHQSPINIDIAGLKKISMPNLKWSNLYAEVPQKMSLTNTHNTVVLDMSYNDNQRPSISGGPLAKPYSLKSIHFHWSSSDHKGSEHTVNKKTFPMEMHVVHYRSDLNFSSAVAQDKGLCVVGYIFEIADKCNEALTSMLYVAEQATMEKDIDIDLPNVFRLDTLVDTIVTDYVTYSGSLTTPPCHESVVWIISPYTISVARRQIERFRQISTASGSFGDNYRPLQPLNDRSVNFVTNAKVKEH